MANKHIIQAQYLLSSVLHNAEMNGKSAGSIVLIILKLSGMSGNKISFKKLFCSKVVSEATPGMMREFLLMKPLSNSCLV